MAKDLSKVLQAMENHCSVFEQEIRKNKIPVTKVFGTGKVLQPVGFKPETKKLISKDAAEVKKAFAKIVGAGNDVLLTGVKKKSKPVIGKRIAVLFSGGPAAGGHNVVAGLKKIIGKKNTLLGVKAGPKGLLEGNLFEITDAAVATVLNTGGFDFLGSDRTKIKTEEQFQQVFATCKKYKLDAIVVIGGDDSNTNAAVLAELLFDKGVQVIGVPKTIDGDLQVANLLPISFGFDTATKIYAEMVGNILQDTPSSRKYWHFIKLMGRAASHVALEVALQTKPAICLISEEIAEQQRSLASIIDEIAQIVVARAKKGIKHGVVLIPEGIVEFIPEMKVLVAELNEALAVHGQSEALNHLSTDSALLFKSLPPYIQEMLLAERDSHGNLQVSLIPTERLLIDMTARRVKEIDSGVKFNTLNHFFGYEGRCGAPSLFDAAYTYNLGLIAGSLILAGKTGYMAALTDLDKGGKVLAIPLVGLINIERRHGKDEMVIEKALVKTTAKAFKYFAARRAAWADSDKFASPGPRQLWGPAAKQVPISVALNSEYGSLEFKIK
jgi:pyrophosphate--fructose-6-phosphate 1-phosphotransferase